jgi:hypothetical protein
MHIATKKTETSSPNEQTWSNTFHGTLGPHFFVNRIITNYWLFDNLTINTLEKWSGVSQWWSMR